MHEQSAERWETCQIEREEQTGFFSSTVVYTAVTTGLSGHRVVVATVTADAPVGGAPPGWEALAERLEAAGWEPEPTSSSELPTFRRRLRER